MIGLLIGLILGCVFVFFIYAVVDRFICSKLFDDPVKGKLVSALAAWLINSVLMLAMFSPPTTGSVLAPFILASLPSAIIGIYAWRRGLAIRNANKVDHTIFE